MGAGVAEQEEPDASVGAGNVGEADPVAGEAKTGDKGSSSRARAGRGAGVMKPDPA